ncbi:MAG: hypothetical protein AMJ77_03055 [Dehalococcoidia bacterium SM23_28_2]|nr:MAG: hypothetical protein AMJ77_03055 [Dehalococcoidia bacterium SM23_28_2]
MDNDFAIDIDAIFEVIDKADIITVRFLILPQRLLIDTRHSETEGPLIKLVPRADSLEERFKSIKQLRPRFRLPEKITAIWWPKHVRELVTCGAWDRLVKRLAISGFPQTAEQCQEVLDELVRQEEQEVLNAIVGEGYHCVWERTP